MTECPLSEAEKKVLFCITSNLGHPESEFCENLGFKRSTFNTIKNRLRKKGYYHTLRIPNMHMLGYEMFVIAWANYSRSGISEIAEGALDYLLGKDEINEVYETITSEDSLFEVAAEALELFNITFFCTIEECGGMGLSITRDYTQYREHIDKLLQLNAKYDVIDNKSLNTILLSLKQTNFINFFDFSPLLRYMFDMEIDIMDIGGYPILQASKQERKLTENEKKILPLLINYPNYSDDYIASKAEISKNTVTNIKKKFVAEELITERVIPDLKMLGLEVLVFSHIQFKRSFRMDKIERDIFESLIGYPCIFFALGNHQGFMISAFQDFYSYHKVETKLMDYYNDQGILLTSPTEIVYSIKSMNILRNLEFNPLIEDYLNPKNGE